MKTTTTSESLEHESLEQGSAAPAWLEIVRQQVDTLNYGVVQIVVHGSRVVQIERTEKVRLENPIATKY